MWYCYLANNHSQKILRSGKYLLSLFENRATSSITDLTAR